jgi:hypothetical protein
VGEVVDRYPRVTDERGAWVSAIGLFIPTAVDVARAIATVTEGSWNRWEVTRVDVPEGIFVRPYDADVEKVRVFELGARLRQAFETDVVIASVRGASAKRTSVERIDASGTRTALGSSHAEFHRAVGLTADDDRFVDDQLQLVTPERHETHHVGRGMERDRPAQVHLRLRGPGFDGLHSSSFERAAALRVTVDKVRRLIGSLPDEVHDFTMTFEGGELQRFREVARAAQVSIDDVVSAMLMVVAYERAKARGHLPQRAAQRRDP